MGGMIGVAAFNVHFVMSLHFVFTFLHTNGLMVYCFLQSSMDSLLHDASMMSASRSGHLFRLACCYTAVACDIGFVAAYPNGYLIWAASFELVAFCSIMSYFWAWFLLSP